MATTLSLISTVTVGGAGATELDFSSIPATYTDLYMVTSLRDNMGGLMYNAAVKFNTNTTSGGRRMYGDGSNTAATSNSDTDGWVMLTNGTTSTGNTFSVTSLYFPNYAGSNLKNFTIDSVSENNGSTSYVFVCNALWSSTAAINRLTLYSTTAGTFQQYSSASLYGITKF